MERDNLNSPCPVDHAYIDHSRDSKGIIIHYLRVFRSEDKHEITNKARSSLCIILCETKTVKSLEKSAIFRLFSCFFTVGG